MPIPVVVRKNVVLDKERYQYFVPQVTPRRSLFKEPAAKKAWCKQSSQNAHIHQEVNNHFHTSLG